jgi:hypothetical protein
VRSARIPLWLVGLALLSVAPRAMGSGLPEYRLKAAFVYNFALFTEWPAEVGTTLNLCVFGEDPFGEEIDPLQGKMVGDRSIAVHHRTGIEDLKSCAIVFIANSAIGSLPRVLDSLRGAAVLTVADSPGAARQGVALNMTVARNKISFEANLKAVRDSGLNLSSKLLRLATEVRQ